MSPAAAQWITFGVALLSLAGNAWLLALLLRSRETVRQVQRELEAMAEELR